ncbi:MAG TPA: DNA alkylation repair protein [Anaerolineae bacterium]|nr:DNA alkylation repair protein [Anaerolineae bacterium]
MAIFNEVIDQLKSKAKPENLKGMARYGMTSDNRLGISIPELRKMAKEIGRDHQLALELWQSCILDARILASMVDKPEEVSEAQVEEWVKEFNSWDLCDQVCMNLFEKTPFVVQKIHDWSKREEEFVKRATYTLIACLAVHDKQAQDEKFMRFFPIIKQGATDERNFVKKAVNWALRNIGKRNPTLNKAAIKLAKEIREMNSKAAHWIAKDAIRELESEAVQKRLKERS